ncbi:LAMI_0G17172g1_1 [Lachancea mirantina]|uniref:LAMI_0G17172g1_1 n=1 Tax=Lachancea mirantina TaxID=1230905 RepID=A0A1G4KCS0_9SACH|nr:LAMI_0G17172g1_1 [Lachancea mirantina]
MKTLYATTSIACIISLAGVMLGMDISSLATFLGSFYFNKYLGFPGPLEQGLMTSANPIGGFIGCVFFGVASERLSRIQAFQAFSLVWIMGCIISVAVVNVWMVVAGRAIRGAAIGGLSVLIPTYIGEVVPLNKKGLVTSVVQLSVTVAVLFMFFVCFLLNLLEKPLSFRVAWGLEMAPAILLFGFSNLLSESPRWLAIHGYYDKAQEKMRKLALFNSGEEGDTMDFNKIDVLDFLVPATPISYFQLSRRGLRKHISIGITLQILVQVCGMNTLMFYAVYICDMIGLQGNSKLIAAAVPYSVNVVFTFVPILLLDKLKRRDILIPGSFILAILMLVIGCIMGQYGRDSEPIGGNTAVVWTVTGTPGLLVLLLCFAFVGVFSATLSCCAWLYTNEILPARAKAKGMVVAMSVSWMLNATLTFITPFFLSKIKWVTFVILGSCTFFLAMIVALVFPETYGLAESEIENLFNKSTFSAKAEDSNLDTGCIVRSCAPSPAIHLKAMEPDSNTEPQTSEHHEVKVKVTV